MSRRLILHFLFILQIVWIASAQTDECPIEIDLALDTANEICLGTGRNQVCYGNNNVNITPYEDVEIDFESPGDKAELEQVRTLSLSALDTETGEWGIALMRMLANLNPSSSEDVTVLLFGDVEIEDASGQQVSQIGVANTYANLRRMPNTDSPIMASVAINAELEVTGRLEDSEWLRVIDPETNIMGWTLASLVSDVDVETLKVVEASEPYFAPMQAFYFDSGGQSVGCSSVPRDGIIIQTPEGLRRVTLWVNEVTIDLLAGSGGVTTSLQTEDDGSMSVNVLEGSVYVSNETAGYVAVAGSTVNVKQSSDGSSTTVSPPVSMDSNKVINLPTDALDRDVLVPEPATDEMIADANGYVEVVPLEPTPDTGTTDSGTTDSGTIGTTSDTGTTNNGGKKVCPGNSCDTPVNENKGNGRDRDKPNKP